MLKPGGRLLISVDHPFVVYAIHRAEGRKPNYRATYAWTAEWTLGGHTAQLTFWHRPMHAMTNAFTAAGFRIAVVSEPQPLPAARELFPDDYEVATTGLTFLFFVLQAE